MFLTFLEFPFLGFISFALSIFPFILASSKPFMETFFVGSVSRHFLLPFLSVSFLLCGQSVLCSPEHNQAT